MMSENLLTVSHISNIKVQIYFIFVLLLTGIRMIRDSSSSSSSSVNSERCPLATTPGYIKAIVNLVYSISVLDIDNVSRRLQEMGLVKLIFR